MALYILVNIGSGNGLTPNRRQTITRANVDLLSIRPWGTYFKNVLFENGKFSFKKIDSQMFANCRPFHSNLHVSSPILKNGYIRALSIVRGRWFSS